MGSNKISLRRYSLFLPINKNTKQYLYDIISYVHDVAGGCTYTRFHYPAININNNKILGYLIGRYKDFPEEDVICLITDVDIKTNPNTDIELRSLIDKIKNYGEDEVWLTYHDIKLSQ